MQRDEIARLLPGVFQRTLTPDNPLTAFVAAMEALHAPDETVLAQIDTYFDIYQTPDAFLAALASWVDLERIWVREDAYPGAPVPRFPTGEGRLRELVAAAVYLSKWQGTALGLLRFLELATGLSGFTIDEAVRGDDGTVLLFHIRVNAPASAAPLRDLMQRVIEAAKPAYVTYELSIEAGAPSE